MDKKSLFPAPAASPAPKDRIRMNSDLVTSRDIELAAGLRIVIGRLVKILRRETRNDAMLSITERSTLGLLEQHPGLLPTELAAMEKVTTQSISQVVNNLSALGYVKKDPSTDDKRKVLLSVTPAGKEYIERLRQEKQEWLAHALHEKIAPGEKETLTEAIKILAKLIQE
jgi:DNA-binding MarR family transcriptional regulator